VAKLRDRAIALRQKEEQYARAGRPLLSGLLFGFAASVTSDAVVKVPTGGELTLFQAVGRWA
jgi:hypothetical protein